MIPTGNRPTNQNRPVQPTTVAKYPWKTYVTATIFWCGEQPTDRNPTPNCMSSWDTKWMGNFGGYDNPDPEKRIANHATGEFRPKDFEPKLNPFYIALPYNDLVSWNAHKSEASKVIPWFTRINPQPGKTVLKGRWIEIIVNKRRCFAQWEDCGPWVTDDWAYVFGNKPPKATQNGAAGIDISPSVRDYLSIHSGTKLHWRFVDDSQVPHGPWKKYGTQSANAGSSPSGTKQDHATAQKEYEAYLQELRDRQMKRQQSR
ncbi:MAG: hypothetical protein V4727_02995 [Verrucomicrobiota bacterium]